MTLKLLGMPVSVRSSGRLGRAVSIATVRRRAQRMLTALALADAELSVLLCDDPTIRALNRRYRRRDRATDVLAFALHEGRPLAAACPIPLGDVVISVPTAVRQGRAAGRRAVDEITHLLAHGLLHLLGFDHRTRATERRMQARTDALIGAARGR